MKRLLASSASPSTAALSLQTKRKRKIFVLLLAGLLLPTLAFAQGGPLTPGVTAIANGGTAVTSLPLCLLGSSTDLSVANSTDTKLTIWNRTSTGSYDPGTMYASGNVTVPIAGVYDITAGCNTDNNASTSILKVYINGSYFQNRQFKANGQGFVAGSISLKLAANDVIAIYGWQNSGGAIFFYGSDNSSFFTVRYRPSN